MKRVLIRAVIRRTSNCFAAFALLLSITLIALSQQPSFQPRRAQSRQPAQTASSSLPANQAPSPFHITGVVVDSVSKSPIPNAELSAVPMQRARGNRRGGRRPDNTAATTMTDTTGRFDLPVPAEGPWSLTASARGYRLQAFEEHDSYSSAVVLTAAAPKFDLIFRLPPASSIEGYVLDEAGEAVRDGQVFLSYLPPATPDNPHPRPQNRGRERTDDRGYYKFTGNAPGNYQVSVKAQPWYATSASHSARLASLDSSDSASTVPDPLDVVYSTVWYPGVTDPSLATAISLKSGETREADFRLLPVPGYHLRVSPQPTEDPSRRTADGSESNILIQGRRSVPYISHLLSDGTEDVQPSPTRIDSQGNTDIAGLAPGTYLVHRQGSNSDPQALTTIQIGSNSPRVLDLSQGVAATTVSLKIDPSADTDSLQIRFRNMDTEQVSFADRGHEFDPRFQRRQGQPQNEPAPSITSTESSERTVSLLPGRYEVILNGIGDQHLAGIEASGATATGRIITIGGGSPKLTLHVASGHATVTGTVRLHGHTDMGAMVLLIPATFGDPSGIDIPRRDQSNTDGSFELGDVLPGAYILVAINHGWEVNWSDPATLRRFLLHGIPLDLRPSTDLRETIEAQSP